MAKKKKKSILDDEQQSFKDAYKSAKKKGLGDGPAVAAAHKAIGKPVGRNG